MNVELWSIVGIGFFSIVYLFFPFCRGKPRKVTHENASKSLDRFKDWATWLTGLQTAAMASMGLIVKGENGLSVAAGQREVGFGALLFFGMSIVLSTWVLACLPAIQQRLGQRDIKKEGGFDEELEYDVHHKRIFAHIPIRLGRLCGLYHLYCVVGVVFFGAFIYHSIPKV